MTQTETVQIRSALPLLLTAGAVEWMALGALGWWEGADDPTLRGLLLAVAFGAYAVAALRILETRDGHVTLWVLAVLMRLTYLPLAPEYSAEVYRYLWDGAVQMGGISPYRYFVDSPEVSTIVSKAQALVAEPHLRSPFPPLAQFSFLLVAMAGGAVLQAKLLFLGLDLGTAWLLGRVAHMTARSRRLTQLLYLWSPLLLIETAWSGNYAPLALFFMVLVVLLARVPAAAGAASGLATASLLGAGLAVPPHARRLGWKYLAVFAAVFLAVTLPYALAGRVFFDAMLGGWMREPFMAGPFRLLEAALPGAAPRYTAAGVVLGVMLWATLQRYRPERAYFWILGACVMISPFLRPVHILWILPFAALRASRPWIALSGLVLLVYTGLDGYRLTGAWPDPVWMRLAIWTPFLVLMGLDAHRLWRERVPPPVPLSEPVEE